MQTFVDAKCAEAIVKYPLFKDVILDQKPIFTRGADADGRLREGSIYYSALIWGYAHNCHEKEKIPVDPDCVEWSDFLVRDRIRTKNARRDVRFFQLMLQTDFCHFYNSDAHYIILSAIYHLLA